MSCVGKGRVTRRATKDLSNFLTSPRHFVARTRRLSSPAFHDFVERLEIRTRFAIGKKLSNLQSRQLFRHRRRYKLIDTSAIFLALLFYRLLQRTRQPQRIGSDFRHLLILSTASRGVITSMPNLAGAVP